MFVRDLTNKQWFIYICISQGHRVYYHRGENGGSQEYGSPGHQNGKTQTTKKLRLRVFRNLKGFPSKVETMNFLYHVFPKVFSSCIIAILIMALLASCDKKIEDSVVNTTDKIKILSISASTSTIRAYDTTTVTILAEGEDLSFRWEVDHGYIIGKGISVHYTAGECCVGLNTIKCTVSNMHGEVSDTIKVRVKSYFSP